MKVRATPGNFISLVISPMLNIDVFLLGTATVGDKQQISTVTFCKRKSASWGMREWKWVQILPLWSSSQWFMMTFMITNFSPPYLYLSEPCSQLQPFRRWCNTKPADVTSGDSHALISTWALAEASITLNSFWATLTVEKDHLKMKFELKSALCQIKITP